MRWNHSRPVALHVELAAFHSWQIGGGGLSPRFAGRYSEVKDCRNAGAVFARELKQAGATACLEARTNDECGFGQPHNPAGLRGLSTDGEREARGRLLHKTKIRCIGGGILNLEKPFDLIAAQRYLQGSLDRAD
jgi:hypothetical protein